MLSTPLIVLGTLAILLCIAGILEFQNHLTSLNAIPLRIHVNGTRGKSSVTRLIAAGLREGGLRTFAKTTGTAPRVIDEDGKDRIIHRLRLPSIGEQVRLLKYFASDAFYYIAIANNSGWSPLFSFDGEYPTNGFHPFRDYWSITGPFLDYIQFFFF